MEDTKTIETEQITRQAPAPQAAPAVTRKPARRGVGGIFENRWVRLALWCGVALTPLFAQLACETVSRKSIHALEYIAGGAFLGFILSALLFLTWLALFGRPWAAALLTALPLWLMGTVNYFKYQIRGENFYPWEAALAKDAGSFADFLPQMHPTFYMIFFLMAVIVWTAVLALSGLKMPVKWYIRLPAAALFAAALAFVIFGDVARAAYPDLFGITPSAVVQKQDENYAKNGFLSAFAVNMGNMHLKAPDGWSGDAVDAALMDYAAQSAGADTERPDVIVILSEAFWDPTLLEGTEFSSDPLENYRRIAAENHGGLLVSPSFGGGTVQPEFEVMTGATTDIMTSGAIPYLQYIHGPTWSFARYFKNMGYHTLGLHTYSSKFYGRSEAYPQLGFDELRGSDDFITPLDTSGVYASDDMLVDEMVLELEKSGNDGIFLFCITMENHGLYIDKYHGDEVTVAVKNPKFTDEENENLVQYAQGVKNADAALGRLYDYIQNRDRPTAVLYFGDHLPALGPEYSQFVKSGMVSTSDANLWTKEEIMAMHCCPYVIFTNYDAPNPFPEGTQRVSAFHLLNLLREYAGLPGCGYFEFLLDYMDRSPVTCTNLSLYTEGTEDMRIKHRSMSYELLKGRMYTD